MNRAAPGGLDRWELYERCVQGAADAAALLARAHGRAPLVLAEDFAGSAALSRAWVARSPRARALAVDLDDDALARARGHERIRVARCDVRDRSLLRQPRADVVHAGNFSLGYLKSRSELVEYLSLARRRLREDGILACDTYGGPSAYERGRWEREVVLEPGLRCVSTWEHRWADARTSEVENVLHFRVERGREVVHSLPEAFVYRWRLWSVRELGEALREAGFPSRELYLDLEQPLAEGAEPAGDYVVCLVARRA